MSKLDEQRRNILIKALSYGMFATGAAGLSVPAWSMGRFLEPLPPGKSIYRLSGEVKIDGRQATLDTAVTPNSVIETGAGGKIIFAVGKDAFILREHGKLEMQSEGAILTGLRLITGKLLSVFGKRQSNNSLVMKTRVSTIGIRGTGIYVESEPDQTYVCTCYGVTHLSSDIDKESKETISTDHHESPRYILANAPKGKSIREAPIINHTIEELDLIEALVGRSTPFIDDDNY